MGRSTRSGSRGPVWGFLRELLFSPDRPILEQKSADDEALRFWAASLGEAGGMIPVWRQRSEAELEAAIEAGRARNTKPKKPSWQPPRSGEKRSENGRSFSEG